ncbi:MAG: LysR substrate-binding domain-containing protein [Chromatiales bacterium]|jgi:LysR family glycine cleavage system transcriptional activator
MPFRRLPPLASLRAFEAVARLGSFKQAADELNVTPGAVSQQVKKLEADMGVSLFRRHHRGIEPTETGHILKAGLSDAFLRLSEAVEAARPLAESKTLVVACRPPFAAKWLVPRLGGFADAYPDLELRIAANFTLLDYGSNDIDVGVRLSIDETPGLYREWLLEETVLPLASPAFVEKQAISEPKDLLRVPLLAEESMSFVERSPTWETWFDAAGLPSSRATPTLQFGSHAEQAIEAAVAGAGVVLGRRVLASSDLARGRLVSPFGPELAAGVRYQFDCLERKLRQRKVETFRAWLLANLNGG